MKNNFEYVNSNYGLNLSVGTKCIYTGKKGIEQHGTVEGADGQYVRIAMDNTPNKIDNYHPTWEMTYPNEKKD